MSAGPQTKMIPMTYRALAEVLVRANGLHEGIWRVYLRFGQPTGVNANFAGRLAPSVFVPVMEIGLIRDTELTDLSVDAAVVNPGPLIEVLH